MMKLYEIADRYQEALNYMMESETVVEGFDTLDSIEEHLNDKLDSIGKLRQSKQRQIEMINEEVKRLKDRAATAQREIDKLDNYITYVMAKNNFKKLDTPLFKFSFRKSTSLVVTDLEQVPEHFLKPQPPKPDIAGFKKFLKQRYEEAGLEIPEELPELGVKFETKESLQIK